MSDFFVSILEPKKHADKSGKGHWLAVPPRAKNSAELEEMEREYLATDWLPIPFVGEDGTLDRDLMKEDEKLIAEWCGLGLSLDQYETLMLGDSNEQPL